MQTADAHEPWQKSVDAGSLRALAASWLGWMFDGFENYALVLVAGSAVRQLVDPDQASQIPIYIGGLFAATLWGWAVGGVVAGVLTDYIGRKRMLMFSILWYAVAAGLTALAPNYWLFLLFRFVTGLGLGAEWGPGTAIVAERWPARVRGRAAGVLNSAFGCGLLLASAVWLFVGPLGDQSWRFMFLIGVLPALLILYIRTNVDDPEVWVAADQRRRAARERAAQGQPLSHEERALLRFTMARVLTTPELRRRLGILLIMSISSIVGFWAVSTWIPQYVGQVAAAGTPAAAQWASVAAVWFNVGAVAGYLTLGFLGDAFGRKPTIMFYYLCSVVITLILFQVVKDPTALLVIAAVNGFFTSGQFSWMPMYLPELFPTSVRGSAISLVFDSSRIIAGFGPLLAGVVIANLGGIATAATIFGMVYLLGLVAAPFAGPETRGQPLPE